eukprot:g30273.t1
MEVLEMDFGDSHSHPPVRTTHERHVAKVKKFLTAEATAEANSSKLLQRVLRKRSRDDPHRAIGLRTPEPTWKDRRPKQLGGTLPAVISHRIDLSMGCHASKVQDETCVTWKDTHGFVSRESSVEGPSPRLSFRSMDGVRIYREGDAPLPPMRSTHQRHLTKFDSFLQRLGDNKLDHSVSSEDFLRMTQEFSQDAEENTCEVLASNALFRHCDALLPYTAAPKAPRVNLKPKEVLELQNRGPVYIIESGVVEAVTSGAYELFKPGQAPFSLFAERRADAEMSRLRRVVLIGRLKRRPACEASSMRHFCPVREWDFHEEDPIIMVQKSFKRYIEAALMHLTDLQRRWGEGGPVAGRSEVEELTSLCKECGLASAKAVVACERVLKSRYRGQAVPVAHRPKEVAQRERRGREAELHRSSAALQRLRGEGAARRISAPLPLPAPDPREQAALRLQRAARGWVRARRGRSQVAKERQKAEASQALGLLLESWATSPTRPSRRAELGHGLRCWRLGSQTVHRAALLLTRTARGWLMRRCALRAAHLAKALQQLRRGREDRLLMGLFAAWHQRLRRRRFWWNEAHGRRQRGSQATVPHRAAACWGVFPELGKSAVAQAHWSWYWSHFVFMAWVRAMGEAADSEKEKWGIPCGMLLVCFEDTMCFFSLCPNAVSKLGPPGLAPKMNGWLPLRIVGGPAPNEEEEEEEESSCTGGWRLQPGGGARLVALELALVEEVGRCLGEEGERAKAPLGMMTALRQSRSQTPAQVEKTVANGDRPSSVEIGKLGATAIIGDIALIGAALPRPASVRAGNVTEILRIPATALAEVLRRFPGCLQGITARLKEAGNFLMMKMPVRYDVVNSLEVFAETEVSFKKEVAAHGRRYVCTIGEVVADGIQPSDECIYVMEYGVCSWHLSLD